MSAINALVQNNAVHMLTDGAAYFQDRTFQFLATKILPFPHLRCAVAVRGPAMAVPMLSSILGHAETYDARKVAATEALNTAESMCAPIFDACCTGADFEVVVGGITDDGVPDAYLVASHDRYGFEPWKVTPVEGLTCLPNDPKLHAKIIASLPAGATPDDLDPVRDGLAIMELQRRNPAASTEGDDRCAVGGFAQLTTITANEITTRVIRRWPDQVGRVIGG